MASKLVLFADGTGNSSRSSQKTIYSDGVGTSSNRILAAIGGATGWGVKKNVLTLYKFLCRNYPNRGPRCVGPIAEEDRPAIYAFGFSRGAFTIRVLIGLIHHAGLVTFGTEEELSHNAAAAYRSFRSASFTSWSPFVIVGRLVRDGLVWLNNQRQGRGAFSAVQARTEKSGRKDVPIAFLGLWDTVEAYGMPIEELKHVVDLVFLPLVFDDFKLSGLVRRARHALSLDDQRATFWPIPWNEQEEYETLQPPRIQQVWFAGVHSNLGGGYPEDQLSYVSLVWIMKEAKAAGLDFAEDALEDRAREQSPYARIYDSRAGLASYYRYRPRRIGTDRDANEVVPLVHHSVIERIAFGSDKYAPITLPSDFDVLLPDGTTEPRSGSAPEVAPAAPNGQDTAMSRYRAAQQTITAANAEMVSLTWDLVWWRRFYYFVTVAATVCLAVFPWIAESVKTLMLAVIVRVPILGSAVTVQLNDRWEAVDDVVSGPVSSLVAAVGGLLPAYAKPWTEALVTYPLEFAAIAAVAAMGFLMGSLLQIRIADVARFAWDSRLVDDYLDWIDQQNKGSRNTLAMLLAASVGLAAWRYFGRYDDQIPLMVSLLLAIGFAVWLAWQIRIVTSFQAKREKYQTSKTLPSLASLKFARYVRLHTWITTPFEILTTRLIPIAFAIMLIVAALLLVNGALFDGLDSAGLYCEGSLQLNETKTKAAGGAQHYGAGGSVPLNETKVEKVGEADKELRLDKACNATGLVLVEGHRYRIDVEVAQPWFDRSVMTDAAGFEGKEFRHLAATLLKRRWTERWFQPIVRIGRYGNDEYLVKSKEVVASYTVPGTVPGCHEEAQSSIWNIPAKVSDQCLMETVEKAKSSELEQRNRISTEITAQDTGELFFYVNDAVLPLLGISELFYGNNRGTAKVRVTRLQD